MPRRPYLAIQTTSKAPSVTKPTHVKIPTTQVSALNLDIGFGSVTFPCTKQQYTAPVHFLIFPRNDPKITGQNQMRPEDNLESRPVNRIFTQATIILRPTLFRQSQKDPS
ncbi:Hypothetical_protein [Hexamita inflata]|uniref:Hypothetical_protein n=1 Tax=Hexamita inflata TaxID=28002 RepID=A0AA86TDK8_9EUKA|nr:Hypothetical protein HINF_LOCUS2490 [Hexamita inflata]CAI9959743.1 Hypothetical protein HINF_LOCUS47388 [Hexamita inflata]